MPVQTCHTVLYVAPQVYRRMLGILNRVTQQSLGIFLEQARELPLSDPTHLPHILSLLLEKVSKTHLGIVIIAGHQ